MTQIAGQSHEIIFEVEATTLVAIIIVVTVPDIIGLVFNEEATTAAVVTSATAAATIHIIKLQHLNNIETYLPYFVTRKVKDIML